MRIVGRSLFTLAAIAVMSVIGVDVAFAGAKDVPLPGSLLLLTSGIVALGAAGWWIRRKK